MKTKRIALIICCFVLLMMSACAEPEPEPETVTVTQPQLVVPTATSTSPVTSGPVYTVTFYSDNGTILKVDKVQEGETALPPVEPQMSYGSIFSGWKEDYSQVLEDREIHPECRSILGQPNVFALTGATGRTGEDTFVSLLLCGEVRLSGVDLLVSYDPEALQLQSVYNEDGGVVFNEEKPGEILINYVSTNNTIADVDLCSFKFRVLSDPGETPLLLQINSIYANDEGKEDTLITPEYELVDAIVHIDR